MPNRFWTCCELHDMIASAPQPTLHRTSILVLPSSWRPRVWPRIREEPMVPVSQPYKNHRHHRLQSRRELPKKLERERHRWGADGPCVTTIKHCRCYWMTVEVTCCACSSPKSPENGERGIGEGSNPCVVASRSSSDLVITAGRLSAVDHYSDQTSYRLPKAAPLCEVSGRDCSARH